MTENLSKQIQDASEAKEETLLNWSEVLKKFQANFGSDVYESWIKNINLKKEFNHYVVLSAPTRFVRDWIVSRYADKILDIIKTFKKSIQRIEFLIEESKNFDYAAAVKKYELLTKKFSKKVGLIHGGLAKDEKESVLKKFLNKSIDILVSTTVIEVGIDFPNANVIVIENANKFGLSQLHQLRGRVGRGVNQGTCILLFKKNLSENAKKRIKILKSTNDGFEIAEEDMRIRGYGDVLGFQQSGIKDFKLADPIHHEELFKLAEMNIKEIENNEKDFKKFEPLLKLYDKADIINEVQF